MAIRYDPKFKKEISSTIRRYNSKINRLKRVGKEDVYIPKKFTYAKLKTLKDTAKTRKQVRDVLKDLEDYIARGGEKYQNGIPTSLYKTSVRYTRSAKRQLYNKLANWEQKKIKIYGVTQAVSVAEMQEAEYTNALSKYRRLKTPKQLKKMITKELEEYVDKTKAYYRYNDLKEWQMRYIDIFRQTGYDYGVPHAVIHDITERLKQLKPYDFNALISDDKAMQAILFHYQTVSDIGLDLAYENMGSEVRGQFYEIRDSIEQILAGYER